MAIALFVIDLTGSPTDLGVVLAAHAIPLVAFLMIGGVWADRLPRHRLMIVTDLARFGLHGLLAVLIFTGTVEIWQIVAIEILFGFAEAFFRPAASGLLPQTVPEEDIQEANAVTSMFLSFADFAGPALAAVLVVGVGAGAAFTIDAVTFLLSAIFLSRVRPRARGEEAEPESGGVLSELRDGYREVRSRAWVWVTLAAISVSLFVALAPWYVLGPVIGKQQYGGVGVYGAVAAAFGAGLVIGSLIGVGWKPRYPLRLGIIFLLPWPPAMMLYAAGLTLVLVIPALILAGVGIALFDVWWLTALADRIPPSRLSRVTSYDWMVSLGLLPLGYLLAGPLAAALGAVEVFIGGCVLAFLVTAVALLPRETRMLTGARHGERELSERPASGVPLP